MFKIVLRNKHSWTSIHGKWQMLVVATIVNVGYNVEMLTMLLTGLRSFKVNQNLLMTVELNFNFLGLICLTHNNLQWSMDYHYTHKLTNGKCKIPKTKCILQKGVSDRWGVVSTIWVGWVNNLLCEQWMA